MWMLLLVAGCGKDDGGRPTDTGPGTPAPDPLPDDVPVEGPRTISSYTTGTFAPLASYPGTTDASGVALLVRREDGTGSIGVSVAGLAPDTAHTAHVHAWPCSADAGGHYLVDPAAPAGEDNELWLAFTSDADGSGGTTSALPVSPRGDALSLVIHDPATTEKMLCADLVAAELVGAEATGPLAPFAAAEPADRTVAGSASVALTRTAAEFSLALTGLDPAEAYAAHVHALPCALGDAGGHYKLDPAVVDTVAENEVWFVVVAGPSGEASDSVAIGAPARSDAQSVVVHRLDGALAPKVACADLEHQGYLPLGLTGETAPIGTDTGLRGSARLERRLDGVTVVSVDLTGLAPGASHPVHVHDRPCAVRDGGDHVLLDPSAPAGEDNELWVEVVADGAGRATRAVGVPALAGVDARSVVIHAADGTRAACADLVD